MPESQENLEKRVSEELKGKNIAHYSVLLTAWIQTRMERDKTLVTLSSGGIGLLMTIINIRGTESLTELIAYAGGFIGFLITIIICLIIYQDNAKHLEREIRGEATSDIRLKTFDTVSLVAFSVGVLCVIIIGILAGWSSIHGKT